MSVACCNACKGRVPTQGFIFPQGLRNKQLGGQLVLTCGYAPTTVVRRRDQKKSVVIA